MTTRALALLSLIALSGCAVYASDRYASNPDNVIALRSHDIPGISLDTFQGREPGLREIGCRGAGPVEPPDGVTFAAYVRGALEDELQLAGLYDSNGNNMIAGTLQEVDFSSVDGVWSLTLELRNQHGNSAQFSEVYEFDTSFLADSACDQTAQAFMPAVQNLVRNIVSDQRFYELLVEL